MNALIFAAGKGERMRPLTEHTPKPLLQVGGKRLIEWHIEKLAALGCQTIVINTSWLAECFEPALGDGSRWGVRLIYSYEGSEPLETGGGMALALPHLGCEPFIAVNGDVFCDHDFALLPHQPKGLAHLLMVKNPDHNPKGDFALSSDGVLHSEGPQRLTFSGIGVYRPELLLQCQHEWATVSDSHPRFKLAPILRRAMHAQQITG
ncbi:MAG: nucleotidyltransferase family protein, partial [Arenimonas sp.]|nr:nucleotidyltransferase family protein [Arenimonas sp.]